MAMSARQLLAKGAECETCGKEHKPHPSPLGKNFAPSWAARDGHPYRARIPLSALDELRKLAAA